MGDGTEVVVRSDKEEKIKLGEDEQVVKNELVGSDETKDNNEDEVVIGLENDEQEVQKRESFEPEDSSLKDSKDEHEVDDFEEAVGDLDETSSNEGGVEDLKVDSSVVGESHAVGEAEFDVEVIQHVKDLKREISVISETNLVPTESDELTVAFTKEEETGDGRFVIKVSLCCEDRSDLLPDMIKTLKVMRLKTLKAEITTVGGRVKNVLFVTGEESYGEEVEEE